MIVRKDDYILDTDIAKTKAYYESITLCDCDACRNFYAQVRSRFPKLSAWLEELGVPIDRPDEIGSVALENEIDYLFVAYTVDGSIVAPGKYEIDLFDGDLFLNIVISNNYFPNQQETKEYFTIMVYNVKLPWVLDEPFPYEVKSQKATSIFTKIKELFHW